MENFWKRFPLASKAILKNLDSKSLARSKKVSREMSKAMDENGRIIWIRSIKKLRKYFRGHEESWKQIVTQTPITVIKQLAIVFHDYYKYTYYVL